MSGGQLSGTFIKDPVSTLDSFVPVNGINCDSSSTESDSATLSCKTRNNTNILSSTVQVNFISQTIQSVECTKAESKVGSQRGQSRLKPSEGISQPSSTVCGDTIDQEFLRLGIGVMERGLDCDLVFVGPSVSIKVNYEIFESKNIET